MKPFLKWRQNTLIHLHTKMASFTDMNLVGRILMEAYGLCTLRLCLKTQPICFQSHAEICSNNLIANQWQSFVVETLLWAASKCTHALVPSRWKTVGTQQVPRFQFNTYMSSLDTQRENQVSCNHFSVWMSKQLELQKWFERPISRQVLCSQFW